MSDLLDDLLAQQPKPTQPQTDPLDDMLGNVVKARASTAIRAGGNPDQVGQANVLAREHGVPPTIVEQNLPEFQRQAQINKNAALIGRYPAIGRWAGDPRNAAVGADDYESLGVVGKALYGLKNVAKSLKTGSFTALGGLYGTLAAAGEIGDQYSPISWIERQVFGESGDMKAAKASRYFQKMDADAATASRPSVDNWLAKNLLTGVESLPLTAASVGAGVVAGPGAAAAIMSSSVGGNEYVSAREKGISPTMSAIYGASQGVIEFATEKVPASRLLTDLANKTPIGKTLMRQLATEIPGEELATVLQDFNEWAVLNPEKPFVDYVKARPSAALETAVATAGGVGATVGVTTAVDRTARAVAKVARRGADAELTAHNGEAIDALMEATAQSKTHARDPEAFKALVGQLGEDTGATHVYVPAEALNAYMQSDRYSGEFDDYRDHVEEGLATGGDVVLPIGEAVSRMAGKPSWEALKDDVRLSAGGQSRREAKTFDESMADVMADLTDKMEQEQASQKEAAAPREALLQSVTDKLQNAGFTPSTARQQAELLTQRAATRASRMGADLTGAEYDGLDVQQVLPERIAAAQKADQLDIVINAMRGGGAAPKKRGTSLTEWIRKRGGIEDRGGDLASMGVGAIKGISKKGQMKLLREYLPGQASMLGADGQENSNSPDELAMRAWEAGYFPEFSERPSVNDLLGAIGEAVAGRDRYADQLGTDAETQAQEAVTAAADDLRGLLDEAGVDVNTATPKEIRAAVGKYAEGRSQGDGFDQSAATFTQSQTEPFKRWSNDAPLVMSEDAGSREFKTGEKIVVEAYHGTARPDRVGERFQKKRATSGPMAYFTSDPTLASNYATAKSDTSIDEGEQAYERWFKFKPKGARTPVDITRAWYSLDPDVKAMIAERMADIRPDDDGNVVYEEGGGDPGSYEWELKSTQTSWDRRGNPLKAAVETWLTSGLLFGEEEKFMTVLKLAGVPMGDVTYDDPQAQHSFVYKTYIAMQNPLVSSDVPEATVEALKAAAKKDRSRAQAVGRDMWDKNTVTLRDWVAGFLEDPLYGWTRIPDKVTAVLKEQGFDGIVDWSGKGGGEHHPVYIPFEETQVKSAIGNKGTFRADKPNILHQSFNDGPRGRIVFPTSGYGNGKTVIDLFQSRDQSTFLHETGHLWLEELRFDAGDPNAPDQLKGDWQAVQDWFKANGHPITDGTIPVDAHELWARGVERYLMEGKAPSPSLRKMFETFKSWLVQVYQMVGKLKAPISDDIRAVMDRLIATDEEIANAREQQSLEVAFTEKPATMSDAEWAGYKTLATDARSSAHDTLLAKTMAAVKRRVTKEYKDRAAVVREEVAAEIDSRPEFRAIVAAKATPINAAWVREAYGADATALLPKQVPPIAKEGGAHPDDIAELSGFASGDEMVRALMGVETRRLELKEGGDKRSVREALIQDEVNARMLARYGDPFTDGSIEEEALAAVHNDKQGELIAADLRILARSTNQRPTPYSVAKAWAARSIREGVVRDTASRASILRYERAAAKAGKAAFEAVAAGKMDEAFRQKQAQMLNNALIAEANRAFDEVESAVGRLSKWAKKKTVKSVDQDYLERAQALLEQVEMRPRSQRSLDRQAGFEAWAQEQTALGHDIVVPASFAASLGTTHWSRLTVDQFLGLDAAVDQIIHLGRFKQTLIDGKEARDFEEVVREAASGMDGMKKKPPHDLTDPTYFERAKTGLAIADVSLLKMETIFDWLDGGNPNGVFNRVVFQPIANAQASESGMTEDYFGRVRKAFETHLGKAGARRLAERVTAPWDDVATGTPMVMERQKLIAMALNIGNAGNMQRLVDGYRLNEAAVRSYLAGELNANEWAFVQNIWDIVETLKPQLFAMERRVNGVEPDAVEAVPVETPHGTFRGGYYPAIYDSTRSYAADERQGKATDLLSGSYTRATTRSGASNERAAKVKEPLLLDLGVINRHLGEVIHDITHREAVMQANKFLSDRRIMEAVDTTLGPEYRKQFRPWLQHVANQWAMERAGNEGWLKFARAAKANTTIVGMGFRATTVITQIAGYTNSFEFVGAKWVAPEIGRFAAQFSGKTIKAVTFQGVEMPPMMAVAMEKSGEVRHRMDTLDRDIGAAIRDLAGNNTASKAWRAGKEFAFHGIGYMDRMVVVPTWVAAYKRGLSENMTEEHAVQYADKAVRMSQGAGAAKDLAAIQRGTGALGFFGQLSTMFYSFFSALYQRQRTLGRDVRSASLRDIPDLLARGFWLLIIGPILPSLLAGRGPKEDEDWGIWAFKQMLFNALGPIPIVRDLAQPVWDKIAGNHGFDYQLSPIQRAGQSLVNAAGDVGKLIRGDETKHATRDILEATGYLTGLVPGQIAASTQFLVDVGNGDADPDGVAEWYEGLTKGKIKAD